MQTRAPADFTVQHVMVTWTKYSRGGPAAALRNAAAHGYPLPPDVLPGSVHHVRLDERDDFTPVAGWQPLAGSTAGWRDHELRLRADGSALHLRVVPGAYGMPPRPRRPPAVRLEPGEWLRWQINFRLTGAPDGHWWYRLDTFNVARLPYPQGVFLGGPTRRVDERASLR